MKTLKKVIAVGYLAYAVGKLAGVRAAVGRWGGTDEHVPLLGRTKDPGGFWIRRPFGDEALIVFRGRGSSSPEAERDRRAEEAAQSSAAEAHADFGEIIGTPRVILGPPPGRCSPGAV